MKRTLPVFLILLLSLAGKGQIDPSNFMTGSQNDARYLGGEYLRPLGNSLSHGLNNGWYQTAKTKKLGRFSIMITPSLIQIPTDQQSFQIDESRLEVLELVNPQNSTASTAFGEGTSEAELTFKNDTLASLAGNFRAPGGAGIGLMAVPMANVSVGLIKNTELSVRYLPTMGIFGLDRAEIGMFGVGVKHDVLQWLPMDKAIPVDLSLFFGYSRMELNVPLNEDDQEVVMTSTGYTFRGILSKKLLFFTPYLGLGYNSGQTRMQVNGTFDPVPDHTGDELKDPLDMTADDAGGFVGNVGFRLKFLWVMAFSADYTFGYYNSATLGLGVSVDF